MRYIHIYVYVAYTLNMSDNLYNPGSLAYSIGLMTFDHILIFFIMF